MKKITFTTRLASLPEVTVIESAKHTTPAQIKKQARISISLAHASIKLGFLHAVLIRFSGNYFLLAGPSGVGKSTLSEQLVRENDAEIIANDWVAVEKDKNSYYVSDLNVAEELKHKERIRLSGIILLQKHDRLLRDAYVPSTDEFVELIEGCFDGLDCKGQTKLASFWKKQQKKLPFYCVVPSQDNDTPYVASTISRVIHRVRPGDSLIEIGIIGVGEIGTALASELGKLSFVHKIHLYNRSKGGTVGLALDLNQAMYRGRSDIFVAHDSKHDVFKRSSIVFLAFREKDVETPEPNVPTRWQKVRYHTKTIKMYGDIASDVGFLGTIFVITNPVEFLAYAYYFVTQPLTHSLRTFQVYGVGLEGDIARAAFYGKRFSPSLEANDIAIIGNHADEFVLKSSLTVEQNSALAQLVKDASDEVKSHTVRTVHGPVAAAVRTLRAFTDSSSAHVSVVSHHSYIGQKVSFRFGLPRLEESADILAFESFIAQNKARIAKYKEIL